MRGDFSARLLTWAGAPYDAQSGPAPKTAFRNYPPRTPDSAASRLDKNDGRKPVGRDNSKSTARSMLITGPAESGAPENYRTREIWAKEKPGGARFGRPACAAGFDARYFPLATGRALLEIWKAAIHISPTVKPYIGFNSISRHRM